MFTLRFLHGKIVIIILAEKKQNIDLIGREKHGSSAAGSKRIKEIV